MESILRDTIRSIARVYRSLVFLVDVPTIELSRLTRWEDTTTGQPVGEEGGGDWESVSKCVFERGHVYRVERMSRGMRK